MNQTVTLQKLTNRLNRIDAEILAIRQDLKEFPQNLSTGSTKVAALSGQWVDKAALRRHMELLFDTLRIQGSPAGAVKLQERITQSSLIKNEVSQSLIAAREE